jgi:Outer membrane protein beta-barrel family
MGRFEYYGILFVLFILSANQQLHAQSTMYSITGRVMDKSNDIPLPAIWVSILDLKNDSVVRKIQTRPDGYFEISFKKGEYNLSISSKKHEPYIKPIDLSSFKEYLKDVGSIRLEPLSIQLNDVAVVSKDIRTESIRGKKIYHIGNNLKDASGSISNLLSYIPSISVDIDGKIQIRGREPVVMINGRKSNLSKADVLLMLPSDMVKNIEVTTNPSIKDGETDPIINIITDKKKKGVIGGINLSVGTPTTLKGGLHLALNKEKFNGYGLYGIKKENGIKTYSNEFLENKNDNYKERESSSNTTNSLNHFGELQYEYLPSKNSSLAGSVSVYSDENKILYNGTRMSEMNEIMTNSVNQISDNSTNNLSFSKEIEYELKLNGGKDLFKAEFEYELEDKKKHENFTEDASSQIQPIISQSDDKYKGEEMKLKLRFDKTFKNKAYVTAGYRFDRSLVDQDQAFATNDPAPISLVNDIRYTQYTHTGFIDYSNKFKNLYYNIGLRLVNTSRILKDNLTYQDSKRDFLNLLPAFNLSYEFGDKNEVSLNYYNLMSLPRLSYLNNFNTSTDLQRVRVGNPDLEPQNSHTLELSFFKELKNHTLNATLYSKITNGVIQYITTLNEATNIATTMPENIGKAKSLGIDFSYNLSAPSWLNTIVKLNGSYGKMSNDNLGFDEFYSLNTSFVNIIKIKSYKLELSWFYNSPKQINYQTQELSNQYFKTGLSRSIFKSKGNLTFSVIDPFNTGRQIQKINGTNYNYRSEFNPNQRRILLSLFLRFSTESKFRKTEKEIREKGILQ